MNPLGPDPDPLPTWVYIAMLILALVIAALSLWAHAAAPCKALDWMPVKDVSARCLSR